MAVDFYNQGDQEIHEGGQFYIPQELYRLGKFNNTVAPMPMDNTQQVTQEFGIPYTNAFTNAGGGGGGGLGGRFGNLDLGNTKTFQKRVYNPTGPATGWKMQDITGYYDPTSNTYKTLEGKNIEHGGHFTGDPKQGDIEGEDFQFPSMFAMLKKIREKITGPKINKNDVRVDMNKTITDAATTGEGGYTPSDINVQKAKIGMPENLTLGGGNQGQHTTQAAADKAGGSELNTPFVQGGRVGFFQGALADTAEGQAMSPGTSATGEFRGGEGGQGDGNNNVVVNNEVINEPPKAWDDGYGYTTNWRNIFPGGKPFRTYGPLNTEVVEDEDKVVDEVQSPTLGSHLLHKDATARQLESDAAMAALYKEADWKYAQGGRIGFEEGGWSPGVGRDEQGYQSTHSSFEGGQGDGNNQGNTGGITQLNTDLISTKPSMEAMYSPSELASLRARLYNKNLLTEDNINLEGDVTGGIGPIDYGINFTGEGVTGSNVGMGPVNVGIDPHKNIRNISLNQDIGNWNVQGNTDLENYSGAINYQPNDWLTLGGGMDNTGQRNVGFEISKKWGQPKRPVNALSYDDLIYGQNLRHGGLAGIL